jgi:ferredoxin
VPAKREIIIIEESKCDGCGLCVPNCPEGALQIIDGKARLVSDLFCDGLGACIGHCPKGAIKIEQREAEEYNEKRVMENVIKHGKNVIKAHLEHLRAHGEEKYLSEALGFLEDRGVDITEYEVEKSGRCDGTARGEGCPGSGMMDGRIFERAREGEEKETRTSELRQWPVQLHLIPAQAKFFSGADVLLAADCVAYALADFHRDYLKGRSLAIACPKLDVGQEIYAEKIHALIDEARIRSLTVMTMEVPCCMGLVGLVRRSAGVAVRKVPIKHVTVGIKGSVLKEEDITA